MKFAECFKKYLSEGKVIWNNCEIAAKHLQNILVDSNSKTFDLNLTLQAGVDLKDAKTFIYGSVVDNDCSLTNGNPLEYSDISYNAGSLGNSKLIDFSSAQIFISCLIQIDAELILKTLPIIIFCNGTETQNNIYLFWISTKLNDSSTVAFKSSKVCHETTVIVKTVSCKGPLSKETWESAASQNYVYSLAFPCHMLSDDGSLPYNSVATVKSFQQYELFSPNSFTESVNEISNVSSISVEVSCNKVDSLFAIDPVSIADVNVKITPIPGDSKSPAYSIFKDLSILVGLLEGFEKEGKVRWAEQEYDSDNETTSNEILAKLKLAFASFNENPAAQCSSEKQDKRDEDDELVTLITPREELDFTERMWDVLKLAQSFQELLNGLALIFVEMERDNAEQFWLHEDANSYLAEMVKNSYEGKMEKPRLVGLLPLQMLVEIGIEKLKRDYLYFFTSHRLCTEGRLEELVPTKKENDVGARLRSKLEGISKLHHLLELSVYSLTFLHLPVELVRKVIKSALQDYSASEVDYNKSFFFPVSYNDVKSQLETSYPSLWKINVTGSNENGKCHGSACWSTNCPFDIDSNMETSSLNTDDEENSVRYYMTVTTESRLPLTAGIQ